MTAGDSPKRLTDWHMKPARSITESAHPEDPCYDDCPGCEIKRLSRLLADQQTELDAARSRVDQLEGFALDDILERQELRRELDAARAERDCVTAERDHATRIVKRKEREVAALRDALQRMYQAHTEYARTLAGAEEQA